MRFDSDKYSVSATAVGRPVDVHAYADRIVVHQHTGADADEERPACFYIASGSVYLDRNVAALRGMLETMTGHERSA